VATTIRAGKAVLLPYTINDAISAGQPLYDPPTLPTITIIDPSGAARVSSASMVRDSTGNYHYVYVTPASGPLGMWRAQVDATDANGTPGGSLLEQVFLLE
jgi:uncharacterized protein YfaS (alpha-2-macroglobulin family)